MAYATAPASRQACHPMWYIMNAGSKTVGLDKITMSKGIDNLCLT